MEEIPFGLVNRKPVLIFLHCKSSSYVIRYKKVEEALAW